MRTKFTARHFRAHTSLKEYALDALTRLEKFYDGIFSAEIILSYEKPRDSVKVAEVNISVHDKTLNAVEHSNDFVKSIDQAIDKLERQLVKYKTKLHSRKSPLQERFSEMQ
ncbi:MAG: ribosome-associated translation inhibitor RaiA [Bacteroidota bacterium]